MKRSLLALIAVLLCVSAASGQYGGNGSHSSSTSMNLTGRGPLTVDAVNVGATLQYTVASAQNSGTSITIDPTTAREFPITMTGNCTMTVTLSNIPANKVYYATLAMTQGSGPYTMTISGAKQSGATAPALSTTNGTVDYWTIRCTFSRVDVIPSATDMR